MREEAERSETVVERHDHRALRREVLAVIPGQTARAAGEAAAVDPHHHGTAIVRAVRAGPDVEIEAVLGARRLAWRRGGSLRRGGGGTRCCSWRGSTATATTAASGTCRARS